MANALYLGQIFQGFDNNGDPLALGTIEFYEVGTSTPKNVYSDKDTTVSIGSTITLDANGRKKIFLNEDYKAILKDSDGNIIDTQDGGLNPAQETSAGGANLILNFSFETDSDSDGMPDSWDITTFTGGSQSLDSTENTHEAKSIKFVSAGNGGGNAITESYIGIDHNIAVKVGFDLKSSVVDVRNLVQVTWYDSAKSSISSSAIYDDSTTNPTSWARKTGAVIPPSTARYCKLELHGCHSSDATAGTTWFDNVSLIQGNKDVVGADIASATALPVNIPGDTHDVTGTTAITSLESVGIGTIKRLQFDGALTLTHHATNLILPGGNNHVTVAGDVYIFHEYELGTWRLIGGNYAATTSQEGSVELSTDAEAQTGTDATKVITADNLGATVVGIDPSYSFNTGLANNTEAQNTTGKPLMVVFKCEHGNGSCDIYMGATSGALDVIGTFTGANVGDAASMSLLVPDDYYYKYNLTAGITTVSTIQ